MKLLSPVPVQTTLMRNCPHLYRGCNSGKQISILTHFSMPRLSSSHAQQSERRKAKINVTVNVKVVKARLCFPGSRETAGWCGAAELELENVLRWFAAQQGGN